MSGRIRQFFKRNRFLTFGLPFFVLIVGGSFGMTSFRQVRYDYGRNQKTLTREEAAEFGIRMKKPGEITLQKEYEKLQKVDIDTWENKRGPRPWEESNPTNLELQERSKAKLSH